MFSFKSITYCAILHTCIKVMFKCTVILVITLVYKGVYYYWRSCRVRLIFSELFNDVQKQIV
jgi:hypothetical protein